MHLIHVAKATNFHVCNQTNNKVTNIFETHVQKEVIRGAFLKIEVKNYIGNIRFKF